LNPPQGDKKLTQVEVAAKLGKPRSFTFKVENAERELNALELVDYCEALGIDSLTSCGEFFMRQNSSETLMLRLKSKKPDFTGQGIRL
jgi:hypothetical protein